ncbi:MAG: hypothetical protein WD768_14645 [Phycisphaeraceae bacterium]
MDRESVKERLLQELLSVGCCGQQIPMPGYLSSFIGHDDIIRCGHSASFDGRFWPGKLVLNVAIGETISVIITFGAAYYFAPTEFLAEALKEAFRRDTGEYASMIDASVCHQFDLQDVAVYTLHARAGMTTDQLCEKMKLAGFASSTWKCEFVTMRLASALLVVRAGTPVSNCRAIGIRGSPDGTELERIATAIGGMDGLQINEDWTIQSGF